MFGSKRMHICAVVRVNHIKCLPWIYWTCGCGQPTRSRAAIPKLVLLQI